MKREITRDPSADACMAPDCLNRRDPALSACERASCWAVSDRPIDADGQTVLEREALGMITENGSVFAMEGEVLADEHSQSHGAAQPEALVMAVPQANSEPGSCRSRSLGPSRRTSSCRRQIPHTPPAQHQSGGS